MLILCGCDLIDYHQLDGRVKVKDEQLNLFNIAQIQNLVYKK